MMYGKHGLAFRAVQKIYGPMRNADQAAKQMSTQKNMKVLPVTFLTDDERAVQETVSRFANERVAPLIREMEHKKKIDPTLIAEIFKAGFMGICTPVKYGGSGSSFISFMIMTEEMSKVDAAFAILPAVHNGLPCHFINEFASEEIKKHYLPLVSNQWVASFCMSEPTSGSDAFAMKTTAKPDGDDFIINGSKLWISNADLANVFVVFANANPSMGHRGISAFIVERTNPGVSVGPAEDKLGLVCSGTCPVHFENVRVPKTSMIGELYNGYRDASTCLNYSRIGVGAQLLGLAKGCFDMAVKYTLERKQFGQVVYDFQGLQHEIAQIAIELEACRALVYNTGRKLDAGQPITKEAAMAKYYASELVQKVTRKSIDWMGGVGFTKDYMVEKFYRDCKGGTIYEGTSLMQLSTIAKLLKKEYST